MKAETPNNQLLLSEQASISIITCAPGNALFEAFGHSAIRVKDPINNIDVAFNYGIFNFDQPNFYLNFVKGFLYYRLGVSRFDWFIRAYVEDDRSVYEQELNFDSTARQQIFDFLVWNNLPDNRNYLYDYFFDNCATRPRDVVIKFAPAPIIWDSTYLDNPHPSIRQLTDEYIYLQQPWGDFGIDLAMASKINHPATTLETMFLPDYLAKGLDNAYLAYQGGVRQKLIKRAENIYSGSPRPAFIEWWHPFYVLWVLFLVVIAISLFDLYRKKTSRFLDWLLFSITGVAGLILMSIWLFTSHHPAAYNLNIVWLLPTHLIIAVELIRLKNPTFRRNYLLLTLVLNVLLLLSWSFHIQHLHYATVPLILAVSARAILHAFRLSNFSRPLQ